MIVRSITLAVALVLFSTGAQARRAPPQPAFCGFFETCWGPSSTQPARTHRREPLRARHGRHRHAKGHHKARAGGAGLYVAHPAGCPRRAFCGCGASVHVFGHSVRHLWLAANWFRFPAAAPAPGMAAVRRHHVFVLMSHVAGSTWLSYDANSGGHRTRIHSRSIRGYSIRNPRA